MVDSLTAETMKPCTCHCMKIIDDQQRRDWEALAGFPIDAPVIHVPHDYYVRHAAEISAIQMSAGMRFGR